MSEKRKPYCLYTTYGDSLGPIKENATLYNAISLVLLLLTLTPSLLSSDGGGDKLIKCIIKNVFVLLFT